jgi:hypothetical protein
MKGDRCVTGCAHLTGILLAAAVSMTTAEFVEVQKLSPDELRTRFKLPPSCDPMVTALATDPAVKLMTVAIDCRTKPGGAPLAPGPNDRQQPSRPGKGS